MHPIPTSIPSHPILAHQDAIGPSALTEFYNILSDYSIRKPQPTHPSVLSHLALTIPVWRCMLSKSRTCPSPFHFSSHVPLPVCPRTIGLSVCAFHFSRDYWRMMSAISYFAVIELYCRLRVPINPVATRGLGFYTWSGSYRL